MNAHKPIVFWLMLAGFGVLAAVLARPTPVSAVPTPPTSPVYVTNAGASQAIPTAAQGTTSISGNVSITGTPNVSISNTPTVALAEGSQVQIGNATAAPVLTKATDNPDFRPFQTFSNETGSGIGGPQGVLSFAVPNGSRLVIEYVSATCFVRSPGDIGSLGGFRLGVQGGGFAEYELPIQQGISPVQVLMNQSLRAYADPGTGVDLHISGQFPSGSQCAGSLSGHLVSTP